MKIEEDIILKEYTTFKIGGEARYFLFAKNEKDLVEAFKFVRDNLIPFFILGGGSNILASDKGFSGAVIKIGNNGMELLKTQEKNVFKLSAEAGTPLKEMVDFSLNNNLEGLEWAAGIPGTVGGAVCGNAGAFKEEIKDILCEARIFDSKTGLFSLFKNNECEFGYRESVFKKKKDLIIFSASFLLKKGEHQEIAKKIKNNLDYRKSHQPLDFFSAGSIFKNPAGFSAGELIEKCGLKGKTSGDAEVSEKHANFIINKKNAGEKNVKELINLAKIKVKEKFGIDLEEEIRYL